MPRRRLPQNELLPKGLFPHGRRFRAREGRAGWKVFDGPLENAISAYKAWAGQTQRGSTEALLDEFAFSHIPAMVRANRLSERTAADYQRDVEPLKLAIGKIPVVAVNPSHCAVLRDTLSETHGGHARHIMACGKSAFKWAMERGLRNDNPFAMIDQLPQSKSTRLITPAEYLGAYRESCASVQIALTLGLRTAARPGDVLQFGPRNIRNDALHFQQGKTANSVTIALVGELGQIVRNHFAQTIVRETFVHALDGSAYTVTGIGGMLRRYCCKAGVDTFGLSHLRPKAITDVYQDTGDDLRAVMALSGHKTERQALAYVRQYLPIVAQPNGRVVLDIPKLGNSLGN